MPAVETAPPTLPAVNLESEDLRLLQESVTDQYALQEVLQNFFKYETFRTLNHDRRWNNNDSLYWGWVPPKVWEGTGIPRSSLGMPLVFDQILSALPFINAAVTANGDDDWFSVDAEFDEIGEQKRGRQIKAVLKYALEHAKGPSGLTGMAELNLAIHEILQYGNGGVHLAWDGSASLPKPEWVDIRDIYVDPTCPTPNVDEARSVIWRRTVSLDDLEEMKAGDSRLKIPSRAVLAYLSRTTPISNADTTKQYAEAMRGVAYHPGTENFSPVPSERKVEVLIRYTKSRITWVLNRVWVALNIENPYGFIPFAIAPCYIVPGRFYASCLADMNEGNQRYIEGLMNNHLDEVSLRIHPPRSMKRNGMLTPSQQRWRPGALYSMEAADDMQVLMPAGQLLNVFPEVEYLSMLAERRTGVNSMGMGVPRPGNVNRTKGGVDAQLQGGAGRISYIIKNIEDYLIVPMLTKMYAMMRVHTEPNQFLPARDGGRTTFVRGEVLREPVRFKMSAASRVNTQQKLAATFPFLMQFLVQGPFMSELARVKKTIDWDEMLTMLKDSTGVGRNYNLVRKMTEEEVEARKQPPPEVVAAREKAQMDAQTRLQMADKKIVAVQEKVKGDIQKALIAKQADPMQAQIETQKAQMEMQKSIMEFGIEKALAEMELTTAQQKMVLDAAAQRQKMDFEMAKGRQSMQLEAAKGQQAMALGHMDFVNSARQQMMQAQMDAQMQSRMNEQKVETERVTGEAKAKAAAKIGRARTTKAPAQSSRKPK